MKRRHAALALFLAACAAPASALEHRGPDHFGESVAATKTLDLPAARSVIHGQLDRTYPDLFRLYADIHAHPELSGRETRTAALLAARMRALGFAVTEQVGGTGLVAIARNGAGPSAGDALPNSGRAWECRGRFT